MLDGSKLREAIPQTCHELAQISGLDSTRLIEANSRIWESYWPTVEEKWALGQISSTAISLEAWRRTLRRCGRDDDSLARSAVDILSEKRRKMLHLYDDVRETLDPLKPNYRLALITNGASDTQRGSIRALGIEQMFDGVIISGEIGVQKPDPYVFRLALSRLRVEPEKAWHVGDSLRQDVGGARGAGLTAVWLNRAGVARKENDLEPDYTIRSLRDLPSLL